MSWFVTQRSKHVIPSIAPSVSSYSQYSFLPLSTVNAARPKAGCFTRLTYLDITGLGDNQTEVAARLRVITVAFLSAFSGGTMAKLHAMRSAELRTRDDVFTLWNNLKGFDGMFKLFFGYIFLLIYFILGLPGEISFISRSMSIPFLFSSLLIPSLLPVFVWRIIRIVRGEIKLQQPLATRSRDNNRASINRANQALAAVLNVEEAPTAVLIWGMLLHDPLSFFYLPRIFR